MEGADLGFSDGLRNDATQGGGDLGSLLGLVRLGSE
jgi:hypothetical protein